MTGKERIDLKIAIHHKSGSFSDRWIDYCNERGIPYKLVNCYNSDIVMQLQAFDLLLWHWNQYDTKAILFARQLLTSLQHMNIKVFPDINTCWHFDDKLGQKYLLEAIGAPLVPSYVFYDKEEALSWICQANFPKVFKLRGGAGSMNVHLVRTRSKAKVLCYQAFGRGFPAVAGYFSDIRTRIHKTKSSTQFLEKIRRAPKTIFRNLVLRHQLPREKDYMYFQDFIANNEFDTRVTIIGNKAFAFRRMVRKDDFRASGSGHIDYKPFKVHMECIQIAFQVTKRLKMQNMAFDFVMTHDLKPKIVEVSYSYVPDAVYACPGYWDEGLNWHEGQVWPQDTILEDVMATVKES